MGSSACDDRVQYESPLRGYDSDGAKAPEDGKRVAASGTVGIADHVAAGVARARPKGGRRFQLTPTDTANLSYGVST